MTSEQKLRAMSERGLDGIAGVNREDVPRLSTPGGQIVGFIDRGACAHGERALALLRVWAKRGAMHREAQAQWDAAVAALLAEAGREAR